MSPGIERGRNRISFLSARIVGGRKSRETRNLQRLPDNRGASLPVPGLAGLDRSCRCNCYYVAGKNGRWPAFDGSILPSIDSGDIVVARLGRFAAVYVPRNCSGVKRTENVLEKAPRPSVNLCT